MRPFLSRASQALRLRPCRKVLAVALVSACPPAVLPGQVPQVIGQALTSAVAEAPLPNSPSAVLAADTGQSTRSPRSERDPEPSVVGLPERVLLDELHVVTSPARIRTHDLVWLLPLAGATAAAFATDTHTMRDVVTHDTGVLDASSTSSDVLRDGFIGVPVALFAYGQLAGSGRPREAGLLSGEAMIDALILGEAVKLVTFRERPLVDNARGRFFHGLTNGDSSFPSGHAIVAWSSAAALAGEYNRPWQQVAIYTLASGVSLTRITSQQHFPSDALVGSAAGWLIGHYVYRAHHRHPS